MGRLSASLLALALLGAATLALSACGGGGNAKLLPGGTASEINSNLDQVRELVSARDCIGAENAAASVSEEIEALEGVDAKLKESLQQGVERLNAVVGECAETAARETEAEEEAPETAEEAEEAEEGDGQKAHRPQRHKQEAEPQEPEQTAESREGPTLPPNSNGKGEENGKGGGPPVESGGKGPSGGIGPGAPVEGN